MKAALVVVLMATVVLARPSSEVYYVVSPNDLLYRNFYYDSAMMPYMNAPLMIPPETPKEPEEKAPEAEDKDKKIELIKEAEIEMIPEGPILPAISEVKVLLKDLAEANIDVPAEVKPLEPSAEIAEEPKPAEPSTPAKPTADGSSILGVPLPIRPQTLLNPWAWSWSNLLPFSLPSLPSLSKARVQVYGV